MTTSNNAQVLGVGIAGGSGLTLLGVPVETSVAIGIGVLFILLCAYLVYKFRNRKFR